jgi:hypothetical protein
VAVPSDLRELGERIAVVRRNKAQEIDAQNFNEAAALRDLERALLAEMLKLKKIHKDGVSEVDEHLIAEDLRRAPAAAAAQADSAIASGTAPGRGGDSGRRGCRDLGDAVSRGLDR